MTTNKQFKIRIAKTKKDLLGILDVQVKTWIDTYTNSKLGITKEMIKDHYKRKLTEEYIKERFKGIKDNSKRNWIVLNQKDEIIGWLGCIKEKNNIGTFGIYILSEYQRLGLGKILLKRGLKWLSYQKNIEIGVVNYNENAIRFYKNFGFKLTGKKEDFKVCDFIGKGWVLKMKRNNEQIIR